MNNDEESQKLVSGTRGREFESHRPDHFPVPITGLGFPDGRFLGSREPGVGRISRVVFGTVADERLHPLRQAPAQAAAGFVVAFVPRLAGADSAVVQCLPRRDIIRNAEDQQTVVHENDLERQACQFAATGKSARRCKGAADFAFHFRPERTRDHIPPLLHFPGNRAHVCRGSDGNAISPDEIVSDGFGGRFEPHFRVGHTGRALSDRVGHHLRVTVPAVV